MATGTIQVRSATRADAAAWLRMRRSLWPDQTEANLRADIERYFAGNLPSLLEVLLALDPSQSIVGFAELSIRPYAEECVTERVAFLEAWYVEAAARRSGVGRALIRAAERWALAQGCVEFASDAVIDNRVSEAAHLAVGFAETAQLRCFRKVLDPERLPHDDQD